MQFTGSEATRALTTDALLSSHPVEVPIKDPKEIGQVFDALSYQKGACVIRQLEAALGADDFKKVGDLPRGIIWLLQSTSDENGWSLRKSLHRC